MGEPPTWKVIFGTPPKNRVEVLIVGWSFQVLYVQYLFFRGGGGNGKITRLCKRFTKDESAKQVSFLLEESMEDIWKMSWMTFSLLKLRFMKSISMQVGWVAFSTRQKFLVLVCIYTFIFIYRERFISIYECNMLQRWRSQKTCRCAVFFSKIYRPDIQEFSSLYSLIYSSRGESSKMAFQNIIDLKKNITDFMQQKRT